MKPYYYGDKVTIIGTKWTARYYKRITGKSIKASSVLARVKAKGKPTVITNLGAAGFPLMVGVDDPNTHTRDFYVHPWDLKPRRRAYRKGDKLYGETL